MMKFCPLTSGSSGNALYVEYGETRLLIDAGKPGKTILSALETIEVDPTTLSGILITHEHSDHIAGAGILCRKLNIPVYATFATWQGMEGKVGKIPPGLRRVFDKHTDFYIGQMGIVPFAVSHDAADPVGYRLWGGGESVAIATDLGVFSRSVKEQVAGSSLVLLESNHDPNMLRCNPRYSSALKNRILGTRGHLSNEACGEALVELAETGVGQVILGHLSGENNLPELAMQVNCDIAKSRGLEIGRDIQVDIARRDAVSSIYTIESATM